MISGAWRAAAARLACQVDVRLALGDQVPADEAGLAMRVGSSRVELDRDGLMVVDDRRVHRGDSGTSPPADPDAPPRERWSFTPTDLRTWLDVVADGAPVAEVMAHLDLVEVLHSTEPRREP